MSKSVTKQPYLTKRVLNSAVSQGIEKASRNAMKTAGSVVTVDGDWVVRKHKDGKIEKLEELERFSSKDIQKKVNKLACK